MLDFYKWLLKELKTNSKYKKTLYIIEGSDICNMDAETMVKEPLIIVGGSRLRSLWRRAKRDSEEKNCPIFKSVSKYVRKYGTHNRRIDDNKDAFRKAVKSALTMRSLTQSP